MELGRIVINKKTSIIIGDSNSYYIKLIHKDKQTTFVYANSDDQMKKVIQLVNTYRR